VAALSDHRFQFPAQRGQVSQLPLHVRKVFAGDCVNRFAGLLFAVILLFAGLRLLFR
jgi:hypothetical protein